MEQIFATTLTDPQAFLFAFFGFAIYWLLKIRKARVKIRQTGATFNFKTFALDHVVSFWISFLLVIAITVVSIISDTKNAFIMFTAATTASTYSNSIIKII